MALFLAEPETQELILRGSGWSFMIGSFVLIALAIAYLFGFISLA